MNILDILPERELGIIEREGYLLLHKHGYKVKGARRCGRVRTRLKRALRARGQSFVYLQRQCEERGVWKIAFALMHIDGTEIDRTKTFRIVLGGGKSENTGTNQ